MRTTIDALEPRFLFAGLTLLTHGYQGNITGWVKAAADDIQDRIGGTNASSIYTMKVADSGGLKVTSFAPDSGQKDFRDTTNAELIIKLDWSDVSDGSEPTGDVAEAVYNYLAVAHGKVPALTQLPMQLMGHSRGASLITALVKQLGESGIWVDQMTSLDPHPVDGDNDFFGISFGDQKMRSYDNVVFADNYWRTDGNANNSDFDGEFIPGTYEGDLNNSVQKSFISAAHAAVTAYYVGTIDTGTSNGGDHPVFSDWYGNTAAKPARASTGYIFSRVGGGVRPASGLSVRVGGSAARSEVGESGAQWSNGFDLVSLSGASIAQGQTLQLQFKSEDRDSATSAYIYVDSDLNPYNGLTRLGTKTFSSDSLVNQRINVPTAAVNEGSYYVALLTTDAAGHARWSYAAKKLTVAEAVTPEFAALSNGKLTVTATAGNDAIVLSESNGNIVAKLGNATQTFSNASVSTIEVYAGAGRDIVDASSMTRAIYVDGGPGMDTLFGGSGNDTLSGGAQSNEINGGLGDDALNGSPGNDKIVGAGGNDRLYSNGGVDTLDGGSNVDRIFGGDGPDLMAGGRGNDKMYGYGGNDTLIGGDNSDILDGGDGTDTGDNDPNDIRVSIEVLT